MGHPMQGTNYQLGSILYSTRWNIPCKAQLSAVHGFKEIHGKWVMNILYDL
jgi:hypothetical protein